MTNYLPLVLVNQTVASLSLVSPMAAIGQRHLFPANLMTFFSDCPLQSDDLLFSVVSSHIFYPGVTPWMVSPGAVLPPVTPQKADSNQGRLSVYLSCVSVCLRKKNEKLPVINS